MVCPATKEHASHAGPLSLRADKEAIFRVPPCLAWLAVLDKVSTWHV